MRLISYYGEETKRKVFLLSCLLVVTTLPFSIRLNSYSIILLVINWIFEGGWRNKLRIIGKNKYALLLMSFYLYHVIGLIYSYNSTDGFRDLEKKITFLVFPMVLSTSKFVTPSVLTKLLNYFVVACLVASLICICNGLYHAFNGDTTYLYYHELSSPLGIHAVYFSVYIGFSIFILLNSLKFQWQSITSLKRILLIINILFFLFMLILLSSKTIIAIVLFIIVVYFSRFLFNHFSFIKGLTFLGAFIFIFVLSVYTIPNVRERFKEIAVNEFEQTNPLLLNDYSQYHFTGGTIRLAIWKTTIEIVANEKAWLFGVGTGDSQDLLTGNYLAKHIYPGDELHMGFITYNTHNQFFQFFITLGSMGLLFFIVILTFLFAISIRKKNSILLALAVIFSAFCLTESALCAQKGIVFFTFFSTLFVTSLLRENNLFNKDNSERR